MKLTFSPIRMNETLTATVLGDILTLNDEALDFGALPAGATLPRGAVASQWIAGDVCRTLGGELIVPLVLPHGVDAPDETLFPDDLDVGDGPVALPQYETPNTEDKDHVAY